MRHLIQEACQGPVRCAAAKLKEGIAKLNVNDLRPVSGLGGPEMHTFLSRMVVLNRDK